MSAHFGDVIIRFSDAHSQTIVLANIATPYLSTFVLFEFVCTWAPAFTWQHSDSSTQMPFTFLMLTLGLIFVIIALFAVVPPLLVVILSRNLMEPQHLIPGIPARFISMALFHLPAGFTPKKFEVIVSSVLIIDTTVFSTKRPISLFLKPWALSHEISFLNVYKAVPPSVLRWLKFFPVTTTWNGETLTDVAFLLIHHFPLT